MSSRFKYCYGSYLRHQEGYDAARKMMQEWLKKAHAKRVRSATTHYFATMLNELIRISRCLKFSYVVLFYLGPDNFPIWRSKQKPCEGLVEELKTILEGVDMNAALRQSNWERKAQKIKFLSQITSCERLLTDLRGSAFNSPDDCVPIDRVDSPGSIQEFEDCLNEECWAGTLQCVFCQKRGYKDDKGLVAHFMAEHFGEIAVPRACPICTTDEGCPLVVHLMERHVENNPVQQQQRYHSS